MLTLTISKTYHTKLERLKRNILLLSANMAAIMLRVQNKIKGNLSFTFRPNEKSSAEGAVPPSMMRCEEALSRMHCVLSIFKKNDMNVYVILLKNFTLFTIAFKECCPQYKLYCNIPPWGCRCSRSFFLLFCLFVFFLELLTTFSQLRVDVFLILQKKYKKIDNLNMCAHLSEACYYW